MSASTKAPSTEAVLDQIGWQVKACNDLGSPFTGRVLALLQSRLDTSSAFGRAVEPRSARRAGAC